MGFLKIIIYFLSLTSLFSILFNEKFEKSFVYSIFFSSFTLYISQLIFKTFNVGYYFLLLLCMCNILLIVREYKKDKLVNFKNNYFSYGLFAVLLIFAFTLIYDFRRGFTHWDEFSHWGVMVKEMFRLDKFYSENVSALMVHKDYPPIFQIYELLFIKINGIYSEAILYRALHIFEFSLILYPVSSIIDKRNINKVFKAFIVPIIFLLTVILFDGHGIVNTIYVDYIMALVIAFSLYLVLNVKEYNLFNVSLFIMSNSFLLLIKQMGLVLYLIICFFLVMKLIVNNFKIKSDKIILFIKKNLKNILVLGIVLLIPILFNLSWSRYISNFNVDKQFVFSDIKMSKLYDVRNGSYGEAWQNEAYFNFTRGLFSRNIMISYVNLSFIQALVLSLFILMVILRKYYNKNDKILLLTSIIIGAIGYTFVMLNLYVFCFGPREGPILASFDRYMSTYILIILFTTLLIFIKNNSNIKLYVVLTVLLVILQTPGRFLDMYPILNSQPNNVYLYHADNIRKYVKTGDSVFIVAQDSVGDYQFYTKYYLDGVKTNLYYYSFDLDEDVEKYYEKNVKSYLKKFDYVYLAKINEKYIEKYSFLFNNNNIQENQMYKVENKKGSLQLKLVSE